MDNLDGLYQLYASDQNSPEFWSKLRNIVLRFARHDEDLASDAMLKLIEAIPSYRHERKFTQWVSTIVNRVRIDAARTRREFVELTDSTIPASNDPEFTNLSELPPLERQIAEFILQGYSLKESAERVGLKPDAARKRMRRLIKKS